RIPLATVSAAPRPRPRWRTPRPRPLPRGPRSRTRTARPPAGRRGRATIAGHAQASLTQPGTLPDHAFFFADSKRRESAGAHVEHEHRARERLPDRATPARQAALVHGAQAEQVEQAQPPARVEEAEALLAADLAAEAP